MKLAKLLFVMLCVNTMESATSLVCLPAENDGYEIGLTMAAYLDIDGYTNKSVRTCKGGDCDEMDNFKYCKSPLPKFIIKSIGSEGNTFVVSNRCNGGFKKFKRVGVQDPEGTFLFEEKMAYQIKHQVWNSTHFVPQPVLEIREREGFIELIVQDFTEDLWQIEWEREDIDVSTFTINDEDAASYRTICTSEDSFTTLEKLKSMIPKEEKKLLLEDSYLNLNNLKDDIAISVPKENLIINEKGTINKSVKKDNIKFNSTMPTLKKSGKLNFPDKARKSYLEGEVYVVFDINEYGQPLNIRIKTSSNEIFNEAAINATNTSEYNPALDEYGNAIYIKNLAVTYEFNL
tara:strand:+ start:177 stop:1214 length:1038 start_codon:yes stop_codon:yes gene_type:complete